MIDPDDRAEHGRVWIMPDDPTDGGRAPDWFQGSILLDGAWLHVWHEGFDRERRHETYPACRVSRIA